MDFDSKLTTEQIKKRLLSKTIPMTPSNSNIENSYLAKWKNDSSFYLLQTGGFVSMRPIKPFIGKITTHDTMTTISGNFAYSKSTKVIFGSLIGAIWLILLFACFLNSTFTNESKFFVFVAIAVWTALCYAFLRYLPSIFQKKGQLAVLDFIKNNLLD